MKTPHVILKRETKLNFKNVLPKWHLLNSQSFIIFFFFMRVSAKGRSERRRTFLLSVWPPWPSVLGSQDHRCCSAMPGTPRSVQNPNPCLLYRASLVQWRSTTYTLTTGPQYHLPKTVKQYWQKIIMFYFLLLPVKPKYC